MLWDNPNPLREGVTGERIADGRFNLPDGPGLGIEIDLGAYGVTQGVQEGFSRDEARVLSQLRVMVHWRFAKRFAIFGGPTLSTFFAIDTSDGQVGTPEETDTGETRPGYGYSVGNASFNGNQVYTWPGFILGVQI